MFNAFEAIQAGQLGTQNRERRERKNAFAQAGEAYMGGDYTGAASALMPHDLGAGMQMAQYGQQQQQMQTEQADAAQRQQLEGALALTDNMMQIPEAQRGQWLSQNWDSFAPYFENQDFMTFWQQSGGDVSDATLSQEMGALRTQLGMAAPEADTTGPKFGNQLVEVMGPDGQPAFVRLDDQGGVTPVEGFSPLPEPEGGTSAPRVQSTFIDENGERILVMSDGQLRRSGINNQNLGQVVTIAGVPTLVDRQNAGETPLTSIEEVAGNEAVTTEATETAKSNVTAKAEDRQARMGFARRAQNQIPKIESALKAVEDAIETSNARNTGAIKVPFSGVQALGGLLTTLEANLAFNELGDMRRNSPTGGALGNVSEGELGLLGSTIANLNQDQSEARLDKNLETVRQSLNRLLGALREDAAYSVEGSQLTPDLQAIDDEIAVLEAALGGQP